MQDKTYWIKRRLDWEKCFWEQQRFHPNRVNIINELKKLKFDSLLDAGCGGGASLYNIKEAFPKVKLAGFDINVEAIETVESLISDAEFKLGEIENIPFPDKSFDVVLIDAVLMYIPPESIDNVVIELLRVAKKYIVICDWHDEGLNKYGTIIYSHWVRNYIKLFNGGTAVKIENWKTGGWEDYGNIITYGLQT